jgi:hypothetical protein
MLKKVIKWLQNFLNYHHMLQQREREFDQYIEQILANIQKERQNGNN